MRAALPSLGLILVACLDLVSAAALNQRANPSSQVSSCHNILNTSQLCDATASFFGKLPTVEGRRGQSIALSECADIGRIRRRTGDHVYKVRRRSSRGEGQSRLDCLRLGQSGCAGDHWIRPFDDLRRLYSGYD